MFIYLYSETQASFIYAFALDDQNKICRTYYSRPTKVALNLIFMYYSRIACEMNFGGKACCVEAKKMCVVLAF